MIIYTERRFNVKMRNPLKKEEEKKEAVPEIQEAEPKPVQIVEREVTLSLINEKLNYVTGILHKIAEAAEIKVD